MRGSDAFSWGTWSRASELGNAEIGQFMPDHRVGPEAVIGQP